MKKFEFKLEALLKLREFNEKRLKIELGEILKQITETKDRIEQIKRDISLSYETQEKMMQNAASAQVLQFFPYYIEGRKEEIKARENFLYSLNRKYDFTLSQLAQARGEVKVIENLKEKKKTEHKKEVEKKLQENIEEAVMVRNHAKEMGEDWT